MGGLGSDELADEDDVAVLLDRNCKRLVSDGVGTLALEEDVEIDEASSGGGELVEQGDMAVAVPWGVVGLAEELVDSSSR